MARIATRSLLSILCLVAMVGNVLVLRVIPRIAEENMLSVECDEGILRGAGAFRSEPEHSPPDRTPPRYNRRKDKLDRPRNKSDLQSCRGTHYDYNW